MENRKFSETLAGLVGTSETERGVRLGILAGCVALIILFGAAALLPQSANTVDFDQGQYTGLLVKLVSGYAALLVALILAYYSGLTAPEVKTGEISRAGMLSGAITMLLYWVAQTIFGLVDSARAPQGLQLNLFLRDHLFTGVGFFVAGGLVGWWGYRNAVRRARSIFSPPGTSLPIVGSSTSTTAKDWNLDAASLRTPASSSSAGEPTRGGQVADNEHRPLEEMKAPLEGREPGSAGAEEPGA